MRVKMILTNGFSPDPRVYKEVKDLIKQKIEIEILCWEREKNSNRKEVEYLDGIKIKRFFIPSNCGTGMKQIQAYVKYIFAVKKYLKNKKYDILHCHDLDGCFAGVCVKKNSKLIWDMHEFYDTYFYKYHKIKRIIYKMLAKKCFKNTDGYIFVNKYQKKYYEKDIENKISIVVENLPDKELFLNFNKKNTNKTIISFIGVVRDFKAIKTLMDSARDLENIEIRIIGGGTELENLKKIEKKYSNVKILGEFNYYEIKSFYEDTDLTYVVYDSKRVNTKMGLAIKYYESVYLNIPVIVNKNSVMGNEVMEKGYGFIVEYGERESLRDILQRINSKEIDLNKLESEMKCMNKKGCWNYRKEFKKMYESMIENSCMED